MNFDNIKSLNIKYTSIIDEVYNTDSEKNKLIKNYKNNLIYSKITSSQKQEIYENIQNYLFLPFENRDWDAGIKFYSSVDNNLKYSNNSSIFLKKLLDLDSVQLGEYLLESRVYECLKIGNLTPTEYESEENNNYIFQFAKITGNKEIITKILKALI